jgi:hypothetical protein
MASDSRPETPDSRPDSSAMGDYKREEQKHEEPAAVNEAASALEARSKKREHEKGRDKRKRKDRQKSQDPFAEEPADQ